MGKARTSGGGFIRAALLVLMLGALFAAGVGTAAASGNGNGKPESPPGQAECEHGNVGQPCRDDAQPTHGKDCEEHGNQGGVNEDHCGGVTAPEPPPPTATTVTPPPPTTTTTVTTTTTSTPTTPSSPPPTTTTATTTQASPPSTSGQGPKQEEPKDEREPTTAPPKVETSKTDTPKPPAEQEIAVPKDVKGAAVGKAQSGGQNALAVAPKTAGTLPYTGLPAWVYALAGLAALLVGMSLRRLTRAHAAPH